MNQAKAILGWNSHLSNGRDFRVEDHLDGVGQRIVWLAEGLEAPGPADIEVGWTAWAARQALTSEDPMDVLTQQLDTVCRVLALPPNPAFQALVRRLPEGDIRRGGAT